MVKQVRRHQFPVIESIHARQQIGGETTVSVVGVLPDRRVGEIGVRTGDQLQTGDRCVDEQLAEIVFTLRDEVCQASRRRRNAETGVQVRAFELTVDGDHPIPEARQRDGLPNAAP